VISKELLDLLVCPANHTPLALADQQRVASINRAIAAGTVKNKAGQRLERPIDGGLIRQDGSVLYPILDGIPILLVDEGIVLDESIPRDGAAESKS
jgi:uncharacterized protein YbaR (Trm112 family)